MADSSELDTLEVTGPEVTTILLPAEAPSAGYVPWSLAEAREKLRIGDAEDEEVVVATVELIAESKDPAPQVLREQTYAEPPAGTVVSIDTTGWDPPAPTATWADHAKVRAGEDGVITVIPVVILDPADYGFADTEGRAFTSIVAARVGETLPAAPAPKLVDGKLYVHLVGEYTAEQFTPRLVQFRSAEQFHQIDPTAPLEAVKRNGAVLTDDVLAAAVEVKTARAVIYAADHGRIPTDAEIVAATEAFDYPSSIREGWIASGKLTPDEDADREQALVAGAIATWFRARKNVPGAPGQ